MVTVLTLPKAGEGPSGSSVQIDLRLHAETGV
jgi:hypothetical protein